MWKLILLLLLPAALPAEESNPCIEDPAAAACGPGEVKNLFLRQAEESLPSRGLAFTAAENAAPSSPAAPQAAAAKKTFRFPAQVAARNSAPAAAAEKTAELVLFYTYDCPHCRKAVEWFPFLKAEYPGLKISKYEVKRERGNLPLFARYLAEAGAAPSGFPTFFIGGKMIVGFDEKRSPAELRTALDAAYGKPGCPCEKKEVSVPLLGKVDPSTVSLLQFSVALGLLDGLNPCAMWVLMFLMGLLAYTGSQRRMLLIGGIFVAASALVYFSFMAAWFNLFLIIGHARWITAALGAVAAVMGLINLKELFFFRRGVSLMISGKAKVKLAEKIRRLITERETAVMVTATAALAVFVNLIELGCTVGLPAVFTRVISVKQAGVLEKYAYMAVYNAAYVVPLALIVSLFACTMGRYRMTEAHGKILKGVSGALMLALGLLMLLRPEALILN
ncbi:MAG: hypothetical protein AB7V08_08310 [Elusimicrobiales bacterium]